MRQIISGAVATFALAAASVAPATACGLYGGWCWPCGIGTCAPPLVYVSPAPVFEYSSCYAGCGGWAYERLPDPIVQYYYVNQGPTYTGPGNFAPLPTYREGSVLRWDAYRSHLVHYGYSGGRYASVVNHHHDGAGREGPAIYSYRAGPHFRPSHYAHAPRRIFRQHVGSNGVISFVSAQEQVLPRN